VHRKSSSCPLKLQPELRGDLHPVFKQPQIHHQKHNDKSKRQIILSHKITKIAPQHSRRKDDCNDDPDIVLPSTEHEILSTSSHETTPSTSSTVMHERVTRQIHDQDYVQEQLVAVRDLRLTSPNMSETPLQRTILTPSIHVTPLTPGIDHGSRSDSLVAEFENLHTGSHDTASIPVTSRSRETLSPSPARRRRSGSGITWRTHRVEDEEPPAHLTQVEQHLSDVRTQILSMAQVLSSSELHLESGSTIQGLHQQALDLAALRLPSSRIVGLIGDSGVGKSSLINSLLDKVDLARAVSDYFGLAKTT
jgi:ABC-type glutathione transport system ATPase component